MDKRTFLMAGVGGMALGATAALAQGARPRGVDELGRGPGPEPAKKIPVRKAKTTPLFLTPPGWPNGIAVDPARGFWVQEQRHDGEKEKAWLLDFKTDAIAVAELATKTKFYEPQLKLYSMALSRIYRKPVTQCWLHFLSCRKTMEIETVN